MNRRLNIGDMVICYESGVIGKIIRFYIPTSCEEQTMVVMDDGRLYHAPTRTWATYNGDVEDSKVEAIKLASSIGMDIDGDIIYKNDGTTLYVNIRNNINTDEFVRELNSSVVKLPIHELISKV